MVYARVAAVCGYSPSSTSSVGAKAVAYVAARVRRCASTSILRVHVVGP